jgi:hypothetical protein
MNKKFLLLFVLLIGNFLPAQEKLGISNSNYSSTNSIYLNPSSSADSKTFVQFNMVGVNASFFNNIAYLPWFSVWRMKRHPGEIQAPKADNLKLKKFFYANAGLDGPAFVMSKGKFGFGVFARGRSVADLRRMPYQLVQLFLNKNAYQDQSEGSYNIRNFRASNMTWVEYGLNFAMIYKQQQKNQLSFGGNLKYITGINIFYANATHMKGSYNDTMLTVDNISGKLRYNTAGWNTGKGYGLDLGVTYKKMLTPVDNYNPHTKQSNCGTVDYKYKLAASLRDVGYIRFTKGTNKAALNASGRFDSRQDTTTGQIEANLSISKTAGAILATLPTNLSLQADWNFENHIYVNATLVKNLVFNRLTGVPGSDLLSICPRAEFRDFEVAMPLTFHKYLYPQLGFAFRIRSFVLGFDNVIPLLFMKPRTYGLGIYFNLAVSIFKNPACNVKARSIDDCPPNILRKDKSGKNKKGRKFPKKKKSLGV